MHVTVIPIVIGTFGAVPKGLVRELEELKIEWRIETIQTIALLRSARIPRKVQETWGAFLSLGLQWKTISKLCCGKLARKIIMMIIIAQPNICPGEWHAQTPLWFWHTNGSPNHGQTTRPYDNQQQQQQKRELAELWTLLSRRTTERN